MSSLALVMLGGALGAGLRYGVGLAAARSLPGAFPWGTFLVNLLGGFAAGLLLGWLLTRGGQADPWRLFLGVGLLGGFTTFSAFSAETAYMLERGQVSLAALYIFASVSGALALLFAGLWLARGTA
jgi:fluoride exporter